MGHNTSDRKRAEIARADARARRELAGWRRDRNRLEPLDTVEGAHARRAKLTGKCARPDCRRHVSPNFDDWIRHGFGELPLRTLCDAYRCGRVACGLTFQPLSYPEGIPVAFLLGTEARLEVRCRSCGAGRSFTPEEVVEGLERSGTENAGNVGVNVLGQHARGRCRACGYPGFLVEVRRPPAPGTPEFGKAQSSDKS